MTVTDFKAPLDDGGLHVYLNDIMDYDGTGSVDIRADVVGMKSSSTLPGGFASCTFDIYNDPFTTYNAKLVRGNYIGIVHSGTILWEGVIKEVTGKAGEAGVYSVSCGGLWDIMGNRADYCRTWMDVDEKSWKVHPRATTRFDHTSDDELKIYAHSDRTYAAYLWGGWMYLQDDGHFTFSPHISSFYFGYHHELHNSWRFEVDSAVEYSKTPASETQEMGNSPADTGYVDGGTWHNATSISARFICAMMIQNTGSSVTPSANQQVMLDDVRVYCNPKHGNLDATSVTAADNYIHATGHGMVTGDVAFIEGVSGISPDVNNDQRSVTRVDDNHFTFDGVDFTVGGTGGKWACTSWPTIQQAMKDVVGDIFSTGITYDTDSAAGLIAGIKGMRIHPFTTARDALESLAARYTKPFDWGFFSGWTFRCKDLPTSPATTRWWNWQSKESGYTWEVDAGEETQADGVTVLYKDDGTQGRPVGYLRTLTVGSPSNSDVVHMLDLSEMVLSATQADDAADQYLLWVKSDIHRGSARCDNGYLVRGDASDKPAAYLMAGDYVQDANYGGGTLKLLVTSAEYSYDDATLTVEIGGYQPPFAYTPSAQWGGPNAHRHDGLTPYRPVR